MKERRRRTFKQTPQFQKAASGIFTLARIFFFCCSAVCVRLQYSGMMKGRTFEWMLLSLFLSSRHHSMLLLAAAAAEAAVTIVEEGDSSSPFCSTH